MKPLDRLLSGATRVTADTLDAFVSGAPRALVLVPGDPAQRPEAQDVAVVAEALSRQVHGLTLGVVALEAEAAVKSRVGADAVPAVVFVKGGRVISTVSRVQPWEVYARTAAVVFGGEERRAPAHAAVQAEDEFPLPLGRGPGRGVQALSRGPDPAGKTR